MAESGFCPRHGKKHILNGCTIFATGVFRDRSGGVIGFQSGMSGLWTSKCIRIGPDSCEKCGSKNIEQDNDVLDTWFSSALWPFSTMGWPEKIKPWKNSTPQAALSQDLIFFSSGLLA